MKQVLIKETESILLNLFQNIFGDLSDKVIHAATNRILEYEISLYKDTYLTKSFFHRSKPVPLYDFYIPLDLETLSNSKYDTVHKIKTTDCKSIFLESRFVSIIGTAGSGKSTLVKHVLINSISTKFAIPIFIELRELNRPEYSGDIIKYISYEIFNYYKISKKENFIENMLFDGGFLLVFDGYDELGTNAIGKATSQIQKITQKYGQNHYLITSRPYCNIENLKPFSNYIIEGLSIKKQDILINNLLKNNEYIKKRLLIEKNKEVNKSYLTFLENPLLLSLFIVTFEYHPSLPKKKSLFYEKVFQTLYEKHNSITKVNFQAEFYSKLSEDEFRMVLELFSFISYFQNLYDFTANDIRTIILEIKNKYPLLNFDSASFTKDALETVCIWFIDGNYYTFAHRSLQEYFAAKQIQKLDNITRDKVYDFLSSYFSKNYNLIELIAEEPDLNYYNKILIPRIRNLITTYFKEIDGISENVWELVKAYKEFQHLININPVLTQSYYSFLEKYSRENFDNHKLLTLNVESDILEILKKILILNKHFSILEKNIQEINNKTINQNSRILNFTFNTK